MKSKILLVGGAGYIGTVVTNFKKFQSYMFDNLIYKNKFSINEFSAHQNYEFIFGDLRDEKVIKPLINKNDIIIV